MAMYIPGVQEGTTFQGEERAHLPQQCVDDRGVLGTQLLPACRRRHRGLVDTSKQDSCDLGTGSQHGAEQQQFKPASPNFLILVLARRFFSLPCDCEASCLFNLSWGAFMGIKLGNL